MARDFFSFDNKKTSPWDIDHKKTLVSKWRGKMGTMNMGTLVEKKSKQFLQKWEDETKELGGKLETVEAVT